MNFNEKLIEFRKKEGLSQEELGYKLNVTRQTISKWELGQTTPEMDKLVELSKIFGVTVDELTNDKEITNNEVEKIDDMPINDKPQNGSTWKVIMLIIAIFLIAGIILYSVFISKVFNFGKDIFNNVSDKVTSIINQTTDMNNPATEIINIVTGEMKEQLNNNESTGTEKNFKEDFDKEQIQKEVEEIQENFKIDSFNNEFEMYSGTKKGFHVKRLIDKISTNNKKEKDKTITVIYEGENINDTEKLTDIKRNFEDFTDYEVSFEYDENGYIYQVEIE